MLNKRTFETISRISNSDFYGACNFQLSKSRVSHSIIAENIFKENIDIK